MVQQRGHSLLAAWVLAGACALLAACGGGGGAGEPDPVAPGPGTGPVTGREFFPLATDARWIYRAPGPVSSYPPQVSTVTGTSATAAGTGTVIDTTQIEGGTTLRGIFVADGTGLRQYGPPSSDPIDRALDGLQVMRWTARAGDRFEVLDTDVDAGFDYDGDSRNDRVRIQVALAVIGFEAVDVPAGRFEGCARQVLEFRWTLRLSSGAERVNSTTRVESWYAPGIGLVRERISDAADGTSPRGERELHAYRVGSQANDRAGPAVLSVAPTAPVRYRWSVDVSAAFDEPIEPGTVPGGIVVTRADGTPVIGSVLLDGSTLRFVPTDGWTDGRYTARTGPDLRDLLGNLPQQTRSWDFVIDGSGPSLQAVDPPPGRDDLAPDARFVLQLGEAPMPETVNESTVWLSRGATGSERVPVQVTLDGSTITVTPRAPLQPGSVYVLASFGVTDAAGNILDGVSSLFYRTAQVGFDYPDWLPQVTMAHASAVADLNGDGRLDVAVVVDGGIGGVYDRVVTVAGSADGPVGAREFASPAGLMACPPEGLAVGDFNGDGRPDLAVGGHCGVQLMWQDTNGRYLEGPVLTPGARRLRSIDLDDDGRLDLVGVDPDSTQLLLWRRRADGSLGAAQALSLGDARGQDIAATDLDGDGRRDLVLATGGDAARGVALLRQQADGGFAAPQWLDAGPGGAVSGVAVGDLDGNGRPDIAATHQVGGGAARLLLWRQDAAGAFGSAEARTVAGPLAGVAIADLDRDGRADLVAAGQADAGLLMAWQDTAGGLGALRRLEAYGTLDRPGALVVADLNGDGWPDVLLGNHYVRQVPDAAAPLSGGHRLRGVWSLSVGPRPR